LSECGIFFTFGQKSKVDIDTLRKTLCSGPRRRRPGRQAHGGTGLAHRHHDCVVPMRLFRIDQHIKDEPCAKQRALPVVPPAVPQAFLEVSDLWCKKYRITFSSIGYCARRYNTQVQSYLFSPLFVPLHIQLYVYPPPSSEVVPRFSSYCSRATWA
jgi:hypothetical protein